nr:hypothetical protein [Tanacetum cinerariifolium]
MDYAARDQLRKISVEKTWATIEELTRYEEEGRNDLVTPGEGSIDYENPYIEESLGVMECKLDTIIKEAISLIGRSESGRQGQSYFGIGYKSNATSSGGNNPKRPRNETWYKDKAMLAEAQEAGQVFDEEKLAFLADPGIPDGQTVQKIILNNASFQNKDLDTYDSDCDDVSNAKAAIMVNDWLLFTPF